MRTNTTPTRKQAPVINFACPSNQSGLTALIARLSAAVAEVEKWAPVEDRLSLEFSKTADKPKVKGGVTKAQQLISDGEPVLDLPATDWFFHTRDAIEEGRAKALAEAAAEDRAAIEQRYVALLADWDAQEAAYNSKKPRGLAHAKRMVSKAHRAWSAAEAAIVDYEPQTLAEAHELLAYAGLDGKRVFFTPGETDLKTIMRNAAAAIALHGLN
ncbi:hypothetical protein EOW77_0032235 [Bradyrhizobium yuanmingense]|uniref:hypothetical protein n=1 Tax=Bradyrhizobium yuanmingense TaxID=108015 RepID=UPI000FE4167E|nr:hypothetical protein [Bradyrhizobium yuanmingense]TGN75939.1 hypothetical protein EOW77_0032235 [Bradyrhizobium yuanmingense]